MKKLAILLVFLLATISIHAQSIEGLWNTGKENTLISIKKKNNTYEGTIHSSDNSKAEAGKTLVKDVVKNGNIYKGKLYVVDKGEWYNAEFEPKNEKLAITVSNGLGKKEIEWKKAEELPENSQEIKMSVENTFSEEEIKEAEENLDLEEVAEIFGQSNDLEDFEKRLNDPAKKISNLDLNSDGEVDYLKVVEKVEGDKRTIYVQAAVNENTNKTVASIVVVKDKNNEVNVKVVGDEAMYGSNYVIVPAYRRVPVIVSWFWGPRYSVWLSPYRFGYYPPYFRPRGVVVRPRPVVGKTTVIRASPRPVRRRTVIIRN